MIDQTVYLGNLDKPLDKILEGVSENLPSNLDLPAQGFVGILEWSLKI